jgi:hypothetical protein
MGHAFATALSTTLWNIIRSSLEDPFKINEKYKGENRMFEVSEKAQEMIKKTLESRNENSPIRLAYFGGG